VHSAPLSYLTKVGPSICDGMRVRVLRPLTPFSGVENGVKFTEGR